MWRSNPNEPSLILSVLRMIFIAERVIIIATVYASRQLKSTAIVVKSREARRLMKWKG